MRRLLLAAFAAALVAPAPATAAPPVMALADVQAGARCSGLTVVRGTAVTSFDVEVLDVLDRARPQAARILVRVSGPAVDATGIGPGFSGSPILCPDAAGVARTIGALSEAIGEYGGKVVLATPIETMLALPLLPPTTAVRAQPRDGSSVVGARPLAAPLTISGLRPSLARALQRGARRSGRVLLSAPATTRAAFPPQPMVPGAAVSVGLTSGDIAIGALGTATYVDGTGVWIYGHEFEGAGRRALFLQDAVVHTVVNNPLAIPEVSTYKLGAPGNDVGTISADGMSSVAGSVGALPPSFPLRVTARDLDSGRSTSGLTRVADEADVGRPTAVSALALAGASAVAEHAARVLDGTPSRQMGDMCVRIGVRELRRPLRICNRYAVDGSGPNALSGAVAADMGAAVAALESYRFGSLHPTSVEVGMRLRRGLRQAYVTGVRAPPVVRPGQRIRVRLSLRRIGSGVRSTRTVRMRVPRNARSGLRSLRVEGTPADRGSTPEEDGGLTLVFEDDDDGGSAGPETLDEVRRAVAAVERYPGVVASFGSGTAPIELLDDPNLRISGRARTDVVVRRR